MIHGLPRNETPSAPVVDKPTEYTDKLEKLSYEKQQIVMSWMAKNVIHELAFAANGELPTFDLLNRLSDGLDCAPQQLYYGLQWGDEMGYISFESGDTVELLPQMATE